MRNQCHWNVQINRKRTHAIWRFAVMASCVGLSPSHQFAVGSDLSIGPFGIHSDGLGLDGTGVGIGQVEDGRPGLLGVDAAANVHSSVTPAGVFRRDMAADIADVTSHAEQVAGIMISKHPTTLAGVAPNASLYASAYVTAGIDPGYQHALLAIQNVATQPNVRAVNHGWGKPRAAGSVLDGNSLLTSGIDWSAHAHDVLHVSAGNQMAETNSVPTDNYNGVTVAGSARVGGVGAYRQVGDFNRYNDDVFSPRTSIDLLAPGEGISLTDLGSISTPEPLPFGTSLAAPHVTGTVALLQEFADERIMNVGAPRWTENARRHEVMKAVLLNSADKIEDPGDGTLIGMERTVVDTDGVTTWLDSNAFTDEGIPLDLRMGAGHLNANRAHQQLSSGEYDSDTTPVPIRAWDFGVTAGDDDINKYKIDQPLDAESYISITLAWDREVLFDVDGGTAGVYDIGDTFIPDCCFTDLDLYLMPAGAVTLDNRITRSRSADLNDTVEHIFFELPNTGEYEIWIHQASSQFGGAKEYGLAWWGVGILDGDFDDSGLVDNGDLSLVLNNWGDPVPPTPTGWINQIPTDGFVNNNDLSAVLDNWGDSHGSGSLVDLAVPEPTSALLVMVALGLVGGRAQRKSML